MAVLELSTVVDGLRTAIRATARDVRRRAWPGRTTLAGLR
jgi:hypothetical protein